MGGIFRKGKIFAAKLAANMRSNLRSPYRLDIETERKGERRLQSFAITHFLAIRP